MRVMSPFETEHTSGQFRQSIKNTYGKYSCCAGDEGVRLRLNNSHLNIWEKEK